MRNGITRRILRDSKGATAIEYGLIMALIVIAMLGALIVLANTTTGMWNDVSEQVEEST